MSLSFCVTRTYQKNNTLSWGKYSLSQKRTIYLKLNVFIIQQRDFPFLFREKPPMYRRKTFADTVFRSTFAPDSNEKVQRNISSTI